MDQGRPRLDLEVTLLPDECRELFRESLRLSGFWRRVGMLALITVMTTGIAILLGSPAGSAVRPAAVLLGGLAAFAGCYVWAAPRRGARAPEQAAGTFWRVSADRVETGHDGHRLELSWHDIDRVVITRSLIVIELGERDDVLGLPRRTASRLGEQLITRWADDSGAYVLHRRSAGRRPAPTPTARLSPPASSA